MKKEKLILYFNIPSNYREEIYSDIEKNFECSWYFDKFKKTTIKFFDTSKFKKVEFLPRIDIERFHFTRGLIRLLKSDANIYIMIGEVYNLSVWLFMILKKLFFRKKKVILWSHGYYGYEKKINKILLVKPFFRLADGLLLYNNRARNMMIRDGFRPETIHVIYNSLAYSKQIILREKIQASDIMFKHFGNHNPTIIFIGRLTKVKRLEILLEAVKILKDSNKIFNVCLIGDGVERAFLESLSDRHGLMKQVWFYGECFNELKNAELVYNSEICVSPGNVGLTAIHSLMFGTPVITHNDYPHQMPEFECIHDGETGTFFKENDANDLAKVISNWHSLHSNDREKIRKDCYHEIDLHWNPEYQMKVIHDVVGK